MLRGRSKHLGLDLRFLPSFDKFDRVETLVPLRGDSVHVHAAFHRLRASYQLDHTVAKLPNSQLDQCDTAATACSLSAVVLVKVAIAVTVRLPMQT